MLHDTGVDHPESRRRLEAIEQALSAPRFQALRRVEATLPADIDSRILRVHHPALLAQLKALAPATGYQHLEPDTVLSENSLTAALLAVASVCAAVDQVMAGPDRTAFCAVRPPGHHAEPERAMGFCLFNNIAIAAEHARACYGLRRIAIVDFDVHHGNGTQAAFLRQPEVLYISSHQMPWYPGSGGSDEVGAGNLINLPLMAGTDSDTFRAVYRQHVFPALARFGPKLILVSAGFDAHRDDPLGDIQLTEDDYAWLAQQLLALAQRCAQGRLVAALEGGYALPALAGSVAAWLGVFVDA
ncbi:MAG: histone deacetylase family protein [Methylococcales bacterium]|nr:histone deacetylase family protein [Methylococcales bacterium]